MVQNCWWSHPTVTRIQWYTLMRRYICGVDKTAVVANTLKVFWRHWTLTYQMLNLKQCKQAG